MGQMLIRTKESRFTGQDGIEVKCVRLLSWPQQNYNATTEQLAHGVGWGLAEETSYNWGQK